MFGSSFYCIMITKPFLTDGIRDLLFQTAYLMMRFDSKQRRFRSADCEGYVTTDFKQIPYGGMSGIRFVGHVECQTGTEEVSYLVRDNDLRALEEAETGAWLSGADLEKLRDEKTPMETIQALLRPNPIRQVAHGHN